LPRAWVARCGGATRAATVAAAWPLRARRPADDWVLVHDAARCLLRPAWVDRLIDACLDDAVGGLLALPLADTLKQAGRCRRRRVAATIDRARQVGWRRHRRCSAWACCSARWRTGRRGHRRGQRGRGAGPGAALVPGDLENFKLTWPADFALAARLLATREERHEIPTLRIGEGWDVHALVTGRPLVLGGVTIPHSHGLLGHSDADALLHAITDALLGAAGLGDIGRHFPDTDPVQGRRLGVLLAEAARRVREAGWAIGNVDSTIVAQAPKLAPHIPAMRERIAALLGLEADASTSRPRRPRRWARWARAAPSRRAPSACCIALPERQAV
jgi:2-C-methyl-D-erythritol 4-phosphate cytidylyltransferase/2-C-methyl-D-erythritol 2,4-cyclodiphosphate synthase